MEPLNHTSALDESNIIYPPVNLNLIDFIGLFSTSVKLTLSSDNALPFIPCETASHFSYEFHGMATLNFFY